MPFGALEFENLNIKDMKTANRNYMDTIKKYFKLEKNAKTLQWIKANLTEKDYLILENDIIISYRFDFQKRDMLRTIKTINQAQ